jgi:uncharacterized membrane protein YhaH (DUF805 family)
VNSPYNPPDGGYQAGGGGYQAGGGGGYEAGGGGPQAGGGGGYQAGGGYSGYPGGGNPGGGYGGYPGGGYGPQQGYNQQQRGYLEGGPVDFQGAIRQQFDNVLNFTGRASRSAYWWYALALFIVDIVLQIFNAVIGSSALSILIYLILLVVGLSGLSVAVRRMHDTDKSGWLLLLGLIPFVGWIIVLVFMVLPGTPGPNRFG